MNDISNPPNNSRDVILYFKAVPGTLYFAHPAGRGFYWSADNTWNQNRSHGAKRLTQVYPIGWDELGVVGPGKRESKNEKDNNGLA